MALSSTTGGQSSSTAGPGSAGCGGGSLQNSPSLTDDDDDDDDGATTSLSEDAGELACDLSQPSGPAPPTPSDVEDHPPSIQLEKAAAAEKGGGWANSHRRRKSARPQWHYEGTVLDKSQRPPAAAVNGTEDDPAAAAWDADHRGHRTTDGDDASTEDRDDDVCSGEAGAPSRPVTSH